MSALMERGSSAVEESIARKLWTIDEYERLSDFGFLEGHYELIEGEIIEKMGQNQPYFITLFTIMRWLQETFGANSVITQTPITFRAQGGRNSKPEPDAAVLKVPVQSLPARLPDAADVLLIVEVSASSLEYDLSTKADLYAYAGIVEYWVLDINAGQFIVHRDPTAKGYGVVTRYAAHHEISPLAKTEAKIAVSALFPADDTQ
jgi:hypothetical protein